MTRSPSFDEPGAVAPVAPAVSDADGEVTAVEAGGPDSAVPSHYGDPFREQRVMSRSAGVVDRSHRGVLRIEGPERLSWLHLLLTQQVADLTEGAGTEALVLDAQGRVEHHAVVSHVDDVVWLDVEPGAAPALATYLDRCASGRTSPSPTPPPTGRCSRWSARRSTRCSSPPASTRRAATTPAPRCPAAGSPGGCRGRAPVPRPPST